MDKLKEVFHYVYDSTIVKFAARFYMAYKWKFARSEDICSQLTQVPTEFWIKHPYECHARILNDFVCDLVVFETVSIIIVAITSLCSCCCCRRR